jgi:hypothetical protein
VRDRVERVDALEETQLAAIDVAQSRHCALIEQSVADGHLCEARRAQRSDPGVDIEIGLGRIAAEVAERGVNGHGPCLEQLDRGRVEARNEPFVCLEQRGDAAL